MTLRAIWNTGAEIIDFRIGVRLSWHEDNGRKEPTARWTTGQRRQMRAVGRAESGC